MNRFYCIDKYSGNILCLNSLIKPLKSHFNNIYGLIMKVAHFLAIGNSEELKEED